MNNFEVANDQGQIKLGGWDFYHGDLQFIQQAFREALEGLAEPVGDCILSGCQLSQGGLGWEVTEGFISWNGEVYFVPAAVATVIGSPISDDVYIRFERTYDNAGQRQLDASGANVDLYAVWQGRPIHSDNTVLNGVLLTSLQRYEDKLLDKLLPLVRDRKEQLTGLVGLNGWDVSFLRIYRFPDGLGMITGNANGTNATANTVVSLPVGWRPVHLVRGAAYPISISSTTFKRFELNQSGNLNCLTGEHVEFNIPFVITNY